MWSNSHRPFDALQGPPWSWPPRLTSSPPTLPLSHSAPAILASPLSLKYPQYVLPSESWRWLSLYPRKNSSSRNLTVVFKCHLLACIKWHNALSTALFCVVGIMLRWSSRSPSLGTRDCVPPRAVQMMDLTSLIRLFYSTEDCNWRKIIWVDLTSPCESFKSESNNVKDRERKSFTATQSFSCWLVFSPCTLWDLSSLSRDRTSVPLLWELRVLTTGLQGNFLLLILKKQLLGCKWDYMAGKGEWLLGADDNPW